MTVIMTSTGEERMRPHHHSLSHWRLVLDEIVVTLFVCMQGRNIKIRDFSTVTSVVEELVFGLDACVIY